MSQSRKGAGQQPVQAPLIEPASLDPRLANASIICCGEPLPVLKPNTGVQCRTCHVIYTATLPAPKPRARPRRHA